MVVSEKNQCYPALYGALSTATVLWYISLFQLEKNVKAEGNVEVWLMSLMLMAQKSLHGVIRTAAMAIQDQNFQLLEFLNMFPAQVYFLSIFRFVCFLVIGWVNPYLVKQCRPDEMLKNAANNK